MKFSARLFSILTALMLLTTQFSNVAIADNANQTNNVRESKYDNKDTQHQNPLSNIVGMPIRTAAQTAPAVITGTISYHNGPVLINPNIYVIWYGNWSNPCASTGSSTPAIIKDLLTGMGPSSWYGINRLYYSLSGATKSFVTQNVNYAGCAYDSGSLGTSLDYSSGNYIFEVVRQALNSNAFPVDPKGLYFVFPSSNINVSGFLTSFCGYHGTFVPTSAPTTNLAYSFVGDPTGPNINSCNGQTAAISPNSNMGADAMASVIAHELVEAVSDPQLNAWYDSRGNENADKCAWTFGTTSTDLSGAKYNMTISSRKYLIQQNWVPVGSGSCALVAPALSATVAVPNVTFVAGSTVTSTTPVVGAGGSGSYTYSIAPTLPTGLAFNTTSGAITGKPTVTQTSPAYTVTVNDGSSTVSGNFNLTINAPAPLAATIKTTSIKAMVGKALASTSVVVGSGGVSPYSYAMLTPVAGLTLNSATGALSGTASTVLAATTETVRVTDALGTQVTSTFTLQVSPTITATVQVASKTLTRSTTITSFTPVLGGGSLYTPISYSISAALPAGILFNTTTGEITGTAPSTTARAKNYTVTVRDSAGFTATGTFSLTIA